MLKLYKTFGDVFAERCRGWTAHVFTSNPRLADAIGLKPVRQLPLFNGKIPCRLLTFVLIFDSKRQPVSFVAAFYRIQ